MVKPVKHIRPVRTEGRNQRSTIIAIHPDIVKKAGITRGTHVVQELLADGTIRMKPLLF